MQMTIDNYRAQCQAFFALSENTEQAIQGQVTQLTLDGFQHWLSSMMDRYDRATEGVVKQLFSGITLGEDNPSQATLERCREARLYRDAQNQIFNERVFGLACVQEKTAQQQAARQKEEHQRLLEVQVGERTFTAESVIEVLWHGWECDGYAWLVRDEGVARLVTTDHGTAKFSDREMLQERLKAYQDAIAQTQAMLDSLDN